MSALLEKLRNLPELVRRGILWGALGALAVAGLFWWTGRVRDTISGMDVQETVQQFIPLR